MDEAAVAEQVSAEVAVVVDEARELTIIHDQNVNEASELLAQCVRITKQAEKWRKELTKPLLDNKARIDAFFRELVKPASETEARLREAIAAYNTERERTRQEHERLARAELARREKERETERAQLAEAIGVDPAQMPGLDLAHAVVVPELDMMVTTESGSVSARPVTKVTVVEPDAVPRVWCVPDVKAIEAFVKAAVRDNPATATRVVGEVFGGSVTFEVVMTTVVNTEKEGA